jgi:short-subunit dehydrogenase
MNKDLILISGASTGIGFNLAQYFADHGHHVIAGARKVADINRLAQIKNVTAIKLDVTNQEDINKIPKLIEAHLVNCKKLILINNAGVVASGPWELIETAELKNQFSVNIFGAIELTKAVLPYLRQTKGRILNMGSVSGLFSAPYLGPYSASKFALEAFNDSLRRELAPLGVSVTMINPGAIKTPIWNKGLEDPKNAKLQAHPVYGEKLKKFEAGVQNVMSNALEPEHVVRAIYRAYSAKKAPLRVVVARIDVKIFLFLNRFLPTTVVDSLLSRF